ncbi:MAG: hypothetical protein H6R18_301 [Proteobacteria bacterium]|nr:hypothetical protein [Pseudomonadota bacterium]
MKTQLALAVFLGGALLGGCSSKPDVSDVEEAIKEVWEPCRLVKPINIKKENGIDHGDRYQLAISYQIEIVRDIPRSDDMDRFLHQNCPLPTLVAFTTVLASNNTFVDNGLKKGQTFDVAVEFKLIKSENGWVFVE